MYLLLTLQPDRHLCKLILVIGCSIGILREIYV